MGQCVITLGGWYKLLIDVRILCKEDSDPRGVSFLDRRLWRKLDDRIGLPAERMGDRNKRHSERHLCTFGLAAHQLDIAAHERREASADAETKTRAPSAAPGLIGAIPALRVLTQDPELWVRLRAAEALTKLTPRVRCQAVGMTLHAILQRRR